MKNWDNDLYVSICVFPILLYEGTHIVITVYPNTNYLELTLSFVNTMLRDRFILAGKVACRLLYYLPTINSHYASIIIDRLTYYQYFFCWSCAVCADCGLDTIFNQILNYKICHKIIAATLKKIYKCFMQTKPKGRLCSL